MSLEGWTKLIWTKKYLQYQYYFFGLLRPSLRGHYLTIINQTDLKPSSFSSMRGHFVEQKCENIVKVRLFEGYDTYLRMCKELTYSATLPIHVAGS